MSDKVALVVGGTGGIGSATSKVLTEYGIKVYATFFNNQKKATALKDILKNFKIMRCDVKDERAVIKIIRSIFEKETKIDIVINSITSKLKLKAFDILKIEEFKYDIDTILFGSIHIFKHVIPIMKKNKSGIIINLLTRAIIGPSPTRMSSYITAKSALSGLTNSLSVELAPFNIKIMGISPTFVETNLIKTFPTKLLEIEREKQKNNKLIQPDEIARLVLNIVQKAHRYSSGKNIIINTREDIVKLI